MTDTVLARGNVFDPTSGQFTRRDVRFRDGVVVDDEPGGGSDRVVDASGLFVLPGLIDLHCHLTMRRTYGPVWDQTRLPDPSLVIRGVRAALAEARRGVTTVRELGAKNDLSLFLRAAVESGAMPGPDIHAAGAPLSITGGHACVLGRTVDGAGQIRRAVRELAGLGAAWVKMFGSYDPLPAPFEEQYARPEFTLPEFRAAVEEAHHLGLRVTVHAMGRKTIGWCIEAGVDSIEHGVYMDDALAGEMKSAGVAYIPTVSGYTETLEPRWGRGEEWIRRHQHLVAPHREALEAALAAGVSIGVGTDTVGDFVDELGNLVAAGVTPTEALTAATAGNARILGRSDRGRLAAGQRGDAVVVGGDPSVSLEHLRDVRWVVLRGQAYRPEEITLSGEDESAEWNTLRLGKELVT